LTELLLLGAEGMTDKISDIVLSPQTPLPQHPDVWGGFVAWNVEDFVNSAVNLYNDEHIWQTARLSGSQILKKIFNLNNGHSLVSDIQHAYECREGTRKLDFVGAMLW
jgi:hypothetical protein